MGELEGKIALVTGGSGQIGSAICRKLAAQGAHVIVAAGRNLDRAQQLVRQLPNPERHLATSVEVHKWDSVEKLAKTILERYAGRAPHILVNNHGIIKITGSLLTTSEADFDQHIAVNLKGCFLLCKRFIGLMVEQKLSDCSVVNISSIACDGVAVTPQYSASKQGLNGLTKAIAKEFASKGIRVNALLPGTTGDAMNALEELQSLGEEVKSLFQRTENPCPMGRTGRPEEIADVCSFLAGPHSSYITGALLYVSGGQVY